jgi:FixJ family two-component response regulator
MEAYERARIMIIDDDPQLGEVLGEIISSWGPTVECHTKPLLALEELKKAFYHVVLLDVFMPEISGLDLVPEISKLRQDTKIIIMSGCVDKETAIKALRAGAFDFLEKPIEMDLLSHSIRRALDTQKVKIENRMTHEALEQSRKDLLLHKERLEHVNTQLTEANTALSVLAQNIEREREASEKKMVLKTKSLILPIIERLQRDPNLRRYEADLRTLVNHLEDLTSGLATDKRIALTLSFGELRIACMISNGMSTEEIATQLHVASSTVKTHRKHIRRKLKLHNSSHDLRTYLESRISKDKPTHQAIH